MGVVGKCCGETRLFDLCIVVTMENQEFLTFMD